jgi:hypothetical protein
MMMPTQMIRRMAILLVMTLAAFLQGACTHVYKIDEQALTNWPAHEKVAAPITLRLTSALQEYKFDKEMLGDHFVYPLGNALAIDAQAMANEAFSKVTVAKDADSTSGYVLTPRVVTAELTTSAWAFEETDMTLDLEWSLTDSAGKVIWVKTVRGVGRNIWGNIYIHEAEATKRSGKLLHNLFETSLVTITTAREVRQLAPAAGAYVGGAEEGIIAAR